MSIYNDNGFANRRAYLEDLAAEHGLPARVVFSLASMLGHTEDFDGLVCAVEDYAQMSDVVSL